MPYAVPITAVPGTPIPTPPVELPEDGSEPPEPSKEDVAAYHKRYMDGLKELFDSRKQDFGKGDCELVIL